MTKYKTEKRKARVGESILITNADYELSDYQNGGVFMVTNSGTTGAVLDCGMISQPHEYEVIVGQHPQLPNLDEMDSDELIALSEAVMKALRTRSYKNGYDQGRFDAEIEAAHGTYEKSDQQKRDEVVAKAKKDVRELLNSAHGYDHEFIVNSAKRTVVYLRKVAGRTSVGLRGIAKCSPNDCFNAHIGKAIALRRALRLQVPTEYLNVPQPTEIRVDDVVRGTYYGTNSTYTKKVRNIESSSYDYDEGYDFIKDAGLVIIDDTRAGGGE